MIVSSLLLLCACDHFDGDKELLKAQAEEDADQIVTNVENSATGTAALVRDKAKVTGNKLRSWLITPLPPKKANQAVAASYCYRSQTDVLCYRQPVPGWEGRLIAYQGTNAPSPEAAQTQPLPKRVADASILPANKAANAKPVFKELPPPPKPVEKDPDAPPVFDASHEQLPNPTHLPQL